MLTRASHAKNGFLPIVMTELGIVKAVNPPHLANAPSAMEVTELGKVTLVRLTQSENAYLPMDLTELPIVRLVRLLQFGYLQLVVYQHILIKTVEK